MSMAQAPRRSWHGFRWWIVVLLFFATTFNYIDRQVIGILKNTITGDLHWPKEHAEEYYSYIAAVFQSCYALGYLFGGRLMDVIGLRAGYTLSITLWSIFAAATGFAQSLAGFFVARGGLGLAEGGNFPAAVKAVGEWFPRSERALATGIFNAGSNMGPVLGPPLVIWLNAAYGWQMAFIATGVIGLAWIPFWLAMYRKPSEHPKVSPAELAMIQSDPPDPSQKIAWGELRRYRATWAFVAGMGLSAPFWWFYLFWAPDFFQKTFQMDVKNVGVPLITIYLIADVGSVAGGWLSSHLIRKGRSVAFSRKTAFLTCACCVVPVVSAPYMPNAWAAIAVIGLAMAAHQGNSANLYTMVSDTMPRYAVSSVVGMGGFAGSALGIVFSLWVGKVLQQTHSYQVMFLAAPVAYFSALGIIHLLLPTFEQAEVQGA